MNHVLRTRQTLTALIVILSLGSAAWACPYCAENKNYLETLPASLMEGRGNHHHPVSTKNAEAQAFFDQGLSMCFAFNHDEAIRSFCKAASLDTNLAMAHWGIALALGTNYNRPMDTLQAAGAWKELQKARSLMAKVSSAERDYINALAKRYSSDPKADYSKYEKSYSDAMKALWEKYPDDLDAATLYAESMMNLKPWQLWNRDGSPAEGTEKIVAALEHVLSRNPDHPGANHYYIHAVEASKNPGRALGSATRLGKLVPDGGHLVHMPAHTYIRLGDYAGSIAANRAAVRVDSAYKAGGGIGFYTMVYYPHNIHFLAVSCAFAGRFKEAMAATERLENEIYSYAKLDPMAAGILPTRYFILAKFKKWDEILATNIPDSGLAIMETFKHFARGLAFASKGNSTEATKELQQFEEAENRLPEICLIGAINDARRASEIARHMLRAEIAISKGEPTEAISHLHHAVAAQDTLSYDEPEGWYLNAREALGAVLIENGKPAEAEKVFREELNVHPRSGRALFGLWEALKAQGREADARNVRLEFEKSWEIADVELTLGSL